MFPDEESSHLDPVIFDSTPLPSFAAIRRKTFDTIYEYSHVDKSPKGSVDAPIQTLVNLINAHPSYATVSSCSGRIAVFQHGSGKGTADSQWLFVSHDTVDSNDILPIFFSESDTTSLLSFKMEPLLLHVAAANLRSGQELLQIALQTGFRESGLIVTASRVTVAIRTHSLALNVPLSTSGELVPTKEYLTGLIKTANAQMYKNWHRRDQLLQSVKETLFKPVELELHCTPLLLPRLNLWGHAVATLQNDSEVSLFAFGGYGQGPTGRGAKRSNSIYRLNLSCNDSWQEVEIIDTSLAYTRYSCMEVPTRAVTLPPMQGIKAVEVQSVVILFGGRQNPAKASNTIYMYDLKRNCNVVLSPLQVQGQIPAPRWGHSLTSLTGSDNSTTMTLAVMLGGRDEKSVFSDVYILSRNRNDNDGYYLNWQELDCQPRLAPRFAHTCFVACNNLYIFGGNCGNLSLLPVPSTLEVVDISTGKSEQQIMSVNDTNHGCLAQIEPICNGPVVSIFSGGVANNSKDDDNDTETITCYECRGASDNSNKISFTRIQIHWKGEVDFGTLVNHACVRLPMTTGGLKIERVAIIGGGTHGFAFGDIYANSYILSFEYIQKERNSSIDKENVVVQPTDMTSNAKTSSSQANNDTKSVCVVYVTKKNAKVVKTFLEDAKLINKVYRMRPFDDAVSKHSLSNDEYSIKLADCIAIPVIDKCIEMYLAGSIEQKFAVYIIDHGRQVMDYSSSTIGKIKNMEQSV